MASTSGLLGPPFEPDTFQDVDDRLRTEAGVLGDGEEVSSTFDGADWTIEGVWVDPTVVDADGDGLNDDLETTL